MGKNGWKDPDEPYKPLSALGIDVKVGTIRMNIVGSQAFDLFTDFMTFRLDLSTHPSWFSGLWLFTMAVSGITLIRLVAGDKSEFPFVLRMNLICEHVVQIVLGMYSFSVFEANEFLAYSLVCAILSSAKTARGQ